MVPRILIVMLIPGEISSWLNQTNKELCLRYCAYWISLEGRPAVSNTSNIKIGIPKSNVFSGDQLDTLMQRVDDGEPL